MTTFSDVHDATDHTGLPGVSSGAVATDSIWDAAGDLAVGSGANTAAKLTKGADGTVLSVVAGALAWAAPAGGGVDVGTSFPGSPADDDLYYRSDLPCGLYRYESTGTKWLCSTLHDTPWSVRNAIATGGIGSTTASMGNAPTLMSDGDMWVEDLIGSLFVNTTNTGAAYWTIEVNKLDSANAATQIGQISTISNAPDTWVEERVAIDAIVAGSAHLALRWGTTKVSTPGNIFPIIRLTWRHCVDV
jgi:hypothetical protein